MNREDPEQLFEIFDNKIWKNNEDIINDITNKLKEFGYTTIDASKYASDNEHYINFLCEHKIVCGHIWIYEDRDEGYSFDISEEDANGNLNECSICKKVRTIDICDQKTTENENKIILDKKTVEEIIKLIESEEYLIVDNDVVVSDEDGIVLTLKEILKGKHKNYRIEQVTEML